MRSPPTHLLVENVVGFERSETHVELLESLASLGYAAQGAVLSPTEVGVPYSRPRYFVLAKRAPLAFASEPPQRAAAARGGLALCAAPPLALDGEAAFHGRTIARKHVPPFLQRQQ